MNSHGNMLRKIADLCDNSDMMITCLKSHQIQDFLLLLLKSDTDKVINGGTKGPPDLELEVTFQFKSGNQTAFDMLKQIYYDTNTADTSS